MILLVQHQHTQLNTAAYVGQPYGYHEQVVF
jgi:hypothetical protein